jgi:hypothetical protein
MPYRTGVIEFGPTMKTPRYKALRHLGRRAATPSTCQVARAAW